MQTASRHPPGAERYLPEGRRLSDLRRAAATCRGCDLWREATQTVFGEGPATAQFVLVGEQPGDQEDKQGHPFVGPAGRVLDRGLERAGIDPARVYQTNAVKHFRWEAKGKRRIHQTPSRWQIAACRPWLAAELEALHPLVVVLLGAIAAKTVFGPGFRVTRERGRLRSGIHDVATLATVHPASILRASHGARDAEMQRFVDDLKVAAQAVRDRS